MSYVARIRKVASQIASEADNRATALRRKLAESEVQIVQVETQLNTANLAYERLTRFEPELSDSLQRPRCWIDRETRSDMGAIPAANPSKDDAFRCHRCGFDLSFPLKG
jgi:hypothetical protein